jgi:hypothetical protein
MFVWRTKKEVVKLIKDMYKAAPKSMPKYRFLLSNEAPLPFKQYKGIPLEYCSRLPKFQIALVDKNTYNNILDN